MASWLLVAVVGQSPQVVTETLWALACQRRDGDGRPAPVVPAEIHLVLTEASLREVEDRLLGREGGLELLRRAYGLALPEPALHPVGLGGRTIGDVRGEAESVAVGDALVRLLGELCGRPEVRVHASIAGGRKTMGFLLGYALSLLGRPGDELSHVLVREPFFERCDNFWFPMPADRFPDPAARRVGYTEPGRGRVIGDAALAKVELATVPFVPLGEYVSAAELARLRGEGFAAAVGRLRARLARPGVRLDLDRRRLETGGVAVRLSPQSAAMWWLFAQALKEPKPGVGPEGAGEGHAGWLSVADLTTSEDAWVKRYAACYGALVRRLRPLEERDPERAFLEDLEPTDTEPYPARERFVTIRGNLRREIRGQVDDEAILRRLLPDEVRGREGAPDRFGLRLGAGEVEIV
jgi:CRISPR-associated protein (TIGR02584 family)